MTLIDCVDYLVFCVKVKQSVVSAHSQCISKLPLYRVIISVISDASNSGPAKRSKRTEPLHVHYVGARLSSWNLLKQDHRSETNLATTATHQYPVFTSLRSALTRVYLLS